MYRFYCVPSGFILQRGNEISQGNSKIIRAAVTVLMVHETIDGHVTGKAMRLAAKLNRVKAKAKATQPMATLLRASKMLALMRPRLTMSSMVFATFSASLSIFEMRLVYMRRRRLACSRPS